MTFPRSIKRALKAVLGRVAPDRLATWQARRTRRHVAAFERRRGLWDVARQLAEATGATVVAGPFAGLRYPPTVAERHGAPKLVGSYERELHPLLERWLDRPFRRVVDVGTAEGYYAVGLARRLPEAEVVGFELDPEERAQCLAMARLNGVADRVTVHGRCTPARLRAVVTPGALVVCDCEGYEAVLLDPDRVPALETCTILVELHERQAPGVTEALLRRFAATHAATRVDAEARDPNAYPVLEGLPAEARPLAVDEFRDRGQQWLALEPRP